jgi:hypothetical protein
MSKRSPMLKTKNAIYFLKNLKHFLPSQKYLKCQKKLYIVIEFSMKI